MQASQGTRLSRTTERNGFEGRSGQQDSVDCIAVGSLALWRRQRFGLEVFVVGVVVIAPLENSVAVGSLHDGSGVDMSMCVMC